MDFKVHCPGCDKPLRLPTKAAGHHARCPSCRKVFVVPALPELFEETVSTWIEDDLDKALSERQEAPSTPVELDEDEVEGMPTRAHAVVEPVTSSGSVGRRDSEGKRDQPAVRDVSASAAGVVAPARPAPSDPARHKPAEHAQHAQHAESAAPAGHAEPAVSVTPVRGPSASTRGVAGHTPSAPHPAHAPASPHLSSMDIAAFEYPGDLHAGGARPHLVINDCSHNGVLISFDALWLDHEGFRGSMPMVCACTAEDHGGDLIAKPLAFIDRSQAAARSPSDLERGREQHVMPGQTPREVMRLMELLELVPKPFNMPMPYYLGPKHSGHSLECTTATRNDGGITCSVRVPEPRVALTWLARVNGVCGQDYEMLERAVAVLLDDRWRDLPEQCRQRLTVWCRFAGNERFRLYVNDGDFGRVDAGLAGLVITDRRVIFCKYHHRGQVTLEEDAVILVRQEGEFASLTLQSSEGRTRMVKLHREDLLRFTEAIADAPGLRVQVTT